MKTHAIRGWKTVITITFLQYENIGKEKCFWKLTDHSKMQSKCEQTLLCKQHYAMPAILQQKHWVARSILKGPHISGLALQKCFFFRAKRIVTLLFKWKTWRSAIPTTAKKQIQLFPQSNFNIMAHKTWTHALSVMRHKRIQEPLKNKSPPANQSVL